MAKAEIHSNAIYSISSTEFGQKPASIHGASFIKTHIFPLTSVVQWHHVSRITFGPVSHKIGELFAHTSVDSVRCKHGETFRFTLLDLN